MLVAVGLLLMLLADATSSWAWTLPGSIVTAIGSGLFNPVMSSLVVAEGSDEQSALTTGINDAFRQTGIAVGIALLGKLIPTHSIGHGFSPVAFTAGVHHALLLAAAIATAGAVAAVVLIRDRATGGDDNSETFAELGQLELVG